MGIEELRNVADAIEGRLRTSYGQIETGDYDVLKIESLNTINMVIQLIEALKKK